MNHIIKTLYFSEVKCSQIHLTCSHKQLIDMPSNEEEVNGGESRKLIGAVPENHIDR